MSQDIGKAEEWVIDFSLTETESLVVLVRAQEQESLWKDALTIQCAVSDRAGNVLRQID